MWTQNVLWRRLEDAGHEACRFSGDDTAWTVAGHMAGREAGQPASLAYEVRCAVDWSTRNVTVRGWIGPRDVTLTAYCRDGIWRIDGVSRPDLAGLADIDLGFTPATNTLAIRRLDLPVGQERATTAAWLDLSDWTVKPLKQVYRRLASDRYLYRSPAHGYRAELTADASGIVLDYPDLWRAEG